MTEAFAYAPASAYGRPDEGEVFRKLQRLRMEGEIR